MDTKIKVKEEVASALTSQNESESFPIELAVKNNDTYEWYDDCGLGIKTEIKVEAPDTDSFSQAEKKLSTKEDVKNIETYSNDMENDTKPKLEEKSRGSDVYSENERELISKDLIMKKEHSSDCEIEIKEDPWWLERTAEEIKDARNVVEYPRTNIEVVPRESSLNCNSLARNNTSLNPKQDGSEIIESRKLNSDIRETFPIEESLYSDHAGQHMDGKINSIVSMEQNPSYGCDVNKKNITCTSTLVGHSLTDECGKVYKCDICHKSFKQLSSLKQHSAIHEAVNVHKCQVCEKIFSQMLELKQHNLIHKGEKSHKCEICGKTFAYLSKLKQHSLIHEGVKPYKCEVCEKSFTQMSHLKEHNLIHQGVKPHKCEICEKTFAYLCNLKRHNLIHEGVKPYKCEICERNFTRMSHLKEHNLIHKGIKPHKCEICEKTFTQMSTLKQHILIHKE